MFLRFGKTEKNLCRHDFKTCIFLLSIQLTTNKHCEWINLTRLIIAFNWNHSGDSGIEIRFKPPAYWLKIMLKNHSSIDVDFCDLHIYTLQNFQSVSIKIINKTTPPFWWVVTVRYVIVVALYTLIYFLIYQPSIEFVRGNVKEFVPTMDSSLAVSLMRLLDCFFAPFVRKEVSNLFFNFIFLNKLLVEMVFIWILIHPTSNVIWDGIQFI